MEEYSFKPEDVKDPTWKFCKIEGGESWHYVRNGETLRYQFKEYDPVTNEVTISITKIEQNTPGQSET